MLIQFFPPKYWILITCRYVTYHVKKDFHLQVHVLMNKKLQQMIINEVVTILESISALAMNFPRNLNLALTLLMTAALAFRGRGAGNKPQGE